DTHPGIVPAEQRAALLARIDAVPTRLGTADSIPLGDHSVSVVTVGQAWHWFDPATAGPEIARVLRPGGRLGLIWNTRDSSHPFVAELAAVMGPSPAEQLADSGALPELAGFNPWRRRRWARLRQMTPRQVESMVASRSRYLIAPPPEQAAILAAVRTLLATHPHTAGRERFGFPLNVTGYRADAA
ncbi:MAG: methyltransferase domain-containing protein, partial [Propionicimonas sp.]|nr:methyltransferase domain-containing protein [Propionicimonas sp.]